MLKSLKKPRVSKEALERVKHWTRTRFRLGEEAAVFVSEVACAVPGCPPLETVVAFWTEAEKRHHFKIFKPVAEVVEDDLPPSWMKKALLSADILGCECC
jgi:nitrate reductase delta subunit